MISTAVTPEEQQAHPMLLSLLSQKIILFELHPVCIIIFEVELNKVTKRSLLRIIEEDKKALVNNETEDIFKLNPEIVFHINADINEDILKAN